MCIATPVLSSSININTIIDNNESNQILNEEINNIALRVWVTAIPKIFFSGKFVIIKVMCPMFLVEDYVEYEFDDGTFHLGTNWVKHMFRDPGIYHVKVEFDTIFGIPATGSTRVLII
jgi:hypothetical protein